MRIFSFNIYFRFISMNKIGFLVNLQTHNSHIIAVVVTSLLKHYKNKDKN